MSNATLVDTHIFSLFTDKKITGITEKSVQPASIDLSIGDTIWQISGLPSTGGKNGFQVQEFIEGFCLNKFSVTEGAVTLNPTSVYLAELQGTYKLPKEVYGYVSPKSSIGRVDLHCIIICDNARSYNAIPAGFAGKLYALIVPQSFPVQITKNIPVAQLRLFQGDRLFLSKTEMLEEQKKNGIVRGAQAGDLSEKGAVLHLDLHCSPSNLVSQRNGKPIDLRTFDQDPHNYFREKQITHDILFLEPGEFVLATTTERVRVPAHLCAEMIPFAEEFGEIRTHYAGFFDPGFGFGRNGEITDSGAVCEIRNIGTAPLMLQHGQPVCLLRYEKLAGAPEKVYGGLDTPSHYQGQSGVQLGKFFTSWE